MECSDTTLLAVAMGIDRLLSMLDANFDGQPHGPQAVRISDRDRKPGPELCESLAFEVARHVVGHGFLYWGW
jgi:hypothetical protein